MTDGVLPEDEEQLRRPERLIDHLRFLQQEWGTLTWLVTQFTTQASRRWAKYMFLAQIFMAGFSITAPLCIAYIVNGHVRSDYDAVLVGIGLYAGVFALFHISSFSSAVAREWVLGLNHCKMDERITELLFAKPLGQHELHGSRLNHASIEKGYWKVHALQETLIFQGLPALVPTLFALIGLWWVSPIVGACALVITLLYTVWSLWLNYCVGHNVHPIEREFRRINRERSERWEKIVRVITSGLGVFERERLSTAMSTNMAKDRSFWIWFIKQFDLRTFFLQRMFQVSAVSYGSWLVYSGQWQLGTLFPLLMWVDMLTTNLMVISNVERRVAQDIVPVELMIDALSIPPTFDVEAGEELERNGPLRIEFRNIFYAYAGGNSAHAEYPVLRGVNFSIASGEKVALLGPSGAGKTTIMKLLLRFEDPTEGEVFINDTPLRLLKLATYMSQVGYIPQQAQVLDTTLGENLLYGVNAHERKRLTNDDAHELWNLMGALKIDFGPRLAQGLATLVGRHGLKLSGGQAQRVMIGAAVAKQPRLMVIDEATSSLDSTTEKGVQEGLRAALSGGTTALIVAHRLSTVRDLCTKFIVLRPLDDVEEGQSQIEAVAGSFEELIKISPTFRQLAEDQGVVV